MTVEIISRSISRKVWDRVGIKLATPASAVGLTTNCDTGPDICSFHAAAESTILIVVMQLNWLENRSESAILS